MCSAIYAMTTILTIYSASELNHITNILQTSIKPQENLLYCLNEDFTFSAEILSFGKIVYQPTRNYTQIENRKLFDAYLIDTKSKLVQQIFDQLQLIKGWNSRAKFILLCEYNQLTELIQFISKLFIYNVVIVTNQRLFTYYPYKYENLYDPYTDYEEIIFGSDYFPNKLPKLWRNTTLRPQFCVLLPYCTNRNNIPGGTDWLMFHNLLKQPLQFSSNHTKLLTWWGSKMPNGDYNGGLEQVWKHNADFLIGAVSLNQHELITDFDCTDLYYDDSYIWLVPFAQESSHLFSLIRIFNKQTWMSIFSTVIIATLAWFCIGTLSRNEYIYFKSTWHTGTMVLRFIVSEVTAEIPRTLQLKLMYFVTWLFVFTIGTGFEGSLIMTLTRTQYEHQISTVQEVIDKNLGISMPGFLKATFNSSIPRDKIIYDRVLQKDIVSDIEAMVARIVAKRDMTAFTTLRNYEYERMDKQPKPHAFFGMDGIPFVYKLDDFSHACNKVLIFQKGHPMFSQINVVLRGIFKGGLYKHIVNMYLHNIQLKYRKSIKNLAGTKPISLSQLTGIIYLWIIGLVIAGFAFLIEIWKWKRERLQ